MGFLRNKRFMAYLAPDLIEKMKYVAEKAGIYSSTNDFIQKTMRETTEKLYFAIKSKELSDDKKG